MAINPYLFGIYGIVLTIILVINFLYFFQIFRNRMPGDASIPILIVHIALMVFILLVGGLLMGVS